MTEIETTASPGTAAAAAAFPETAYAVRKRLDFLRQVVRELNPRRVLDVGCGTGLLVTLPLAREFPHTHFTGVDSDAGSLQVARRAGTPPNLSYCFPEDMDPAARFDLVIASEVIEHVEDPGEFLDSLRERVDEGGRLVLTLPNGYGPFEAGCLLHGLGDLVHLWSGLRAVKRRIRPPAVSGAAVDTVATSPHLNFFSYGRILRLMHESGFRVVRWAPRAFLCGFGFDYVVRGEAVVRWNARVADRLPARAASGWMFELELAPRTERTPYRRSAEARFRRWLHERTARKLAAAGIRSA